MKITSKTHLDHAITGDHLAFIMSKFKDKQAFFLETVEMPEHLGSLPCGLHGPLMGDAPVPESEVTRAVRGDRPGPSRMCDRPARMVRFMTVVGGPDEEGETILYTAYGGRVAPREPWDRGLNEEQRAESEQFWSEHALSR
jgi:hypothetical protein